MKTIVVYYSMGGNTQWAAEQIAEQLGADLLRVEPQKAYPDKGFKKFFWGGKAAVMAETPALDPYEFDASAYERVIFGFPVWAGNVTPPLRTFVKENKAALRDCRKAAFACQSGSGAEKAFEKLKEALGVSSLDAELVLIDPKDRPDAANGQKIADFCAALR
ncbi:MAG: flavodoxin [Clostridia bacterium]|nr:flavodoxin [Clostridia bacterium]